MVTLSALFEDSNSFLRFLRAPEAYFCIPCPIAWTASTFMIIEDVLMVTSFEVNPTSDYIRL